MWTIPDNGRPYAKVFSDEASSERHAIPEARLFRLDGVYRLIGRVAAWLRPHAPEAKEWTVDHVLASHTEEKVPANTDDHRLAA